MVARRDDLIGYLVRIPRAKRFFDKVFTELWDNCDDDCKDCINSLFRWYELYYKEYKTVPVDTMIKQAEFCINGGGG